jgi:hypothetical protein
MKFAIGIAIALFYALISGLAFRSSLANRALGNADLGFWWSVIGSLLAIAGLGALLGSWLHTRPADD